jgi:gluconolactonase
LINNRRDLLTAAGAGALSALASPAFATWEEARYPDPAVKVIDKRFEQYRLSVNAAVEQVYTGCRWCEGPVWFGDTHMLIWSDIPNSRMMRYDELTGEVSVFRQPSNNSNGNTRDRQGRLVTCEHLTRRVTRTEHSGAITVLCDNYGEKRLNSPNDIIVKSDDSIWFTDPTFGINGNYEGDKATPEIGTNVYRIDGHTGQATIVADGIQGPNGLCFSPNESKIYIIGSLAPNRIYVYDMVEDGKKIANRRVFVEAGDGTPDGMRCDVDGNLWCGWGATDDRDGVNVYAPDGVLIGHISLPERCANVCFGGAKRNRLFMSASQSIYSLYVNTQGVAYG